MKTPPPPTSYPFTNIDPSVNADAWVRPGLKIILHIFCDDPQTLLINYVKVTKCKYKTFHDKNLIKKFNSSINFFGLAMEIWWKRLPKFPDEQMTSKLPFIKNKLRYHHRHRIHLIRPLVTVCFSLMSMVITKKSPRVALFLRNFMFHGPTP